MLIFCSVLLWHWALERALLSKWKTPIPGPLACFLLRGLELDVTSSRMFFISCKTGLKCLSYGSYLNTYHLSHLLAFVNFCPVAGMCGESDRVVRFAVLSPFIITVPGTDWAALTKHLING